MMHLLHYHVIQSRSDHCLSSFQIRTWTIQKHPLEYDAGSTSYMHTICLEDAALWTVLHIGTDRQLSCVFQGRRTYSASDSTIGKSLPPSTIELILGNGRKRILPSLLFYRSFALPMLLTCANRNLQHVNVYLHALVHLSSC